MKDFKMRAFPHRAILNLNLMKVDVGQKAEKMENNMQPYLYEYNRKKLANYGKQKY